MALLVWGLLPKKIIRVMVYFLFPLCDRETCGPVELELVEFSMDLNHSGPMICPLVGQTNSSLLSSGRLLTEGKQTTSPSLVKMELQSPMTCNL